MTTITLSKEHGYVLLTAASTLVVGMWHMMRTGGYRRAAKVPYPIAYADPHTDDHKFPTSDPLGKQKHAFNCAQRGHANFLENLPLFLIGFGITAVKYPTVAAVAGAAWNVSRVLYAVGYNNPNKPNGSGRLIGGIPSSLIMLGLAGSALKVTYDVVVA